MFLSWQNTEEYEEDLSDGLTLADEALFKIIWRLHSELIDWWTDRSDSQGLCVKMEGFNHSTEVLNRILYKHDSPYRHNLIAMRDTHVFRSHWKVHYK